MKMEKTRRIYFENLNRLEYLVDEFVRKPRTSILTMSERELHQYTSPWIKERPQL